MDLFVVNRYLGDDRIGEVNSVEERDCLARLLSKVEERKRKKEEEHSECKSGRTEIEESLQPVELNDISDFIEKKKSKKRKHIVLEYEDSEKIKTLQEFQEKQDGNELVDTESKVTQVEGFTVLGLDFFQKKSKVKRVLPHWLAKPSIVSANLQELTTTVNDIPGLDEDLVLKLKENNVFNFFPVQSQVIPWLLAAHRRPPPYWPCDVCVSAPTGSGKTLAFVIPVIQALKGRVVPYIRALVVLPVQDLAVQVYKVFKTYCIGTDLKVALITGQNSILKEQQQLVKTGGIAGSYSLADIVVSTPGRLVDHIQCTSGFSLKYLRFLVIDEADRVMESVQNDWLYHVEKHINAGSRPFLTVSSLETNSPPPQKLLFSATLSQDPEKLQQLGLFQPKLFTSVVGEQIKVNGVLPCGDDMRGDFVGKYTTPAELSEKFCLVSDSSKPLVLYHLITSNKWQHVLCFASSQQAAHRLALLLAHLGQGQLKVAEISSALKRHDRDQILHKFSVGELDVLVSSDALARGMDIPVVDYVVSYNPPKYVKAYIHRIGRTGRAGRLGTAVTLVLSSQKDLFQQMLHTAGKTSVSELTVSDTEFEPLEERYRTALEALKQDLQKEQSELLRKVQAVKKVTTFKIKSKKALKLKMKKMKKKLNVELSNEK